MANPVEGNHLTFKSGAVDLTNSQYLLCKLSGGLLVLASAATDKIVGIIASKPTVVGGGEPIDVVARNASGRYKVVAGGNVAVGDYLTSNASGQAVTTTTAGDEVIGQALEVGVAGKVITVLAANFRY